MFGLQQLLEAAGARLDERIGGAGQETFRYSGVTLNVEIEVRFWL